MSLFSEWGIFFMSSYCYVGFDMRTMTRAPFSKEEQDASFQLLMVVTFLIKRNFRRVKHFSFLTRCVFLYDAINLPFLDESEKVATFHQKASFSRRNI